MRKIISGIALMIFLLSICFTSCMEDKKVVDTDTKMNNEELVKRGEYLVTIMGCDDCHSPKKMGAHGPEIDMDLRLSGYPSQRPLPPLDSSVIRNGWITLAGDL